MTPQMILLVLACWGPASGDCMAVRAPVESVAECREVFSRVKATLPAGWRLTYPECFRDRRS